MNEPKGGTSRHLTAEEIGRTVDGILSGAERREIEAHLKDCPQCRREVADVQRLVRKRRRRRTISVAAPAAAAILAAIALVAVDDPLSRSVDTTEVRTASEETRVVDVVRPADGAVITGDSVLLAWRPVADATRYELHVTDAEGSVLVLESVRDTAVVLPVSEGLVEGGLHFWYVDALLEDGRALSTGTHRFQLPQ